MVESEGKQQLKFQAQVKFPRLTTKYFKLNVCITSATSTNM